MRTASYTITPRIPRQTASLKIAIVRSSYYPELLDALERAARSAFQKAGVPDARIETAVVPGSFEIPLACKFLAEKEGVRGIIALGVIVEGETHHAPEIARACTDGLMKVQLATGVPVAHGVLFVRSLAQAEKRSRGERNRGREAAEALLWMLAMMEKSSEPSL